MPAPVAPAGVHGDFRPSNLVVRDGRVAAVLDWEMAGWGDPARDLGIATMTEWGCWWPDAELLDRYQRGGGSAISTTVLRWWRCLGYAMVTTFLLGRAASGWPVTAPAGRFLDGLSRARAEWEATDR
jgi:aminoglycoside phosphotransferase (APT) family kinase protein